MNHSNTPNLGVRYETGDGEEETDFALHDIQPGEELTIDYRTFAQEGVDF
jgi:SET domain-containing protein